MITNWDANPTIGPTGRLKTSFIICKSNCPPDEKALAQKKLNMQASDLRQSLTHIYSINNNHRDHNDGKDVTQSSVGKDGTDRERGRHVVGPNDLSVHIQDFGGHIQNVDSDDFGF